MYDRDCLDFYYSHESRVTYLQWFSSMSEAWKLGQASFKCHHVIFQSWFSKMKVEIGAVYGQFNDVGLLAVLLQLSPGLGGGPVSRPALHSS